VATGVTRRPFMSPVQKSVVSAANINHYRVRGVLRRGTSGRVGSRVGEPRHLQRRSIATSPSCAASMGRPGDRRRYRRHGPVGERQIERYLNGRWQCQRSITLQEFGSVLHVFLGQCMSERVRQDTCQESGLLAGYRKQWRGVELQSHQWLKKAESGVRCKKQERSRCVAQLQQVPA
jgi:hypothetical protein